MREKQNAIVEIAENSKSKIKVNREEEGSESDSKAKSFKAKEKENTHFRPSTGQADTRPPSAEMAAAAGKGRQRRM